MADEQNSVLQEKRPDQENPFLAFFANLFTAIKLPFPAPQKRNDNSKKVQPADDSSSSQAELPNKIKPASVGEDEIETAVVVKPVVTFPGQNETFVAPLKLEAEEAERSTNPVLLWQVYAIGGFFVLKWAWSRWNERKGQKKPDDDGPPPADD